MSNSTSVPDSPCIGYCSCSLGDAICKGCGRTQAEVDQWLFYSNEQKLAIWKRINTLDTIRTRTQHN
ncbi:DUF1289 domain-containing protein [Sulfuriferula nivalis]|uniref:DUF1289 domain-containing protein n=1 Tax=Sulfuriferula nivalis TaxID=2675298 RepID=UPI0013898886